jgi:hypothetical protein
LIRQISRLAIMLKRQEACWELQASEDLTADLKEPEKEG